ncbi:mechanosensitive ion channel family protein [Pedobacter cryophilus]|uniref:Mechanosensitive ion channel n=1 Tax=Pedobacter cryophilus TaxID=2571271 RepID=A0A4U1C569_9SPHI|nr:mechanosensitive ion channel domain-containing protein [Pedobacter cryophilus]TKC00519.1 mechanosensitive ion channel [Pedobacter cryophilus]
MYKRFCLLLFLYILGSPIYGQNLKDSIFKTSKENKNTTSSATTVGSADTSFNALIQRVDYYADQFNKINTQLNNGFDTLEISAGLPEIEAMQLRLKNNSFDGNAITLRYLSTFKDYFATSQKQLDKWENELTIYNTSLIAMQETLCGLTTDSTFKNLPADSALRERFFSRVNSLGSKWFRLDSLSTKAILNIGFLQSRVSAAQVQSIEFNEQIKTGLKLLSVRTFTKEYDYLWELKTENFFSELKDTLLRTVVVNFRILAYYLKYSYKVHLINFFLFLLIALWLTKNRNTILKDNPSAISIFKQAMLTSRYPKVAALAVTCTIGPFFYYHPPIILNQIYLIVLMVCVGILIRKIYSKVFIKCWLFLFPFLLFFSIVNLYFGVFVSERLVFFLLTAMLLTFSIWYYKRHWQSIPKENQTRGKYLLVIYFILLASSLVTNVFGRYSLSKIATTTAIFTLIEGYSLFIFVKIITEAIYLQMEVGKIQINTISSYLDFKNLKNRIGNFLRFLSFGLLFIFFTQNLGIFDNIYDATKEFLLEVRKIGSTSFTFGGFILFLFIIYIATIIARVVSYFFEFADEQSSKKTRKVKYGSSLLLVRLSIWIIGFLIAIAASGVPTDKITIILGALGVGIGFGLQNIVNNVVSGLVMVFEKPIQVGDLIEVGDKTGTVRSMGLRASKILTLDGSEVIVPNGDLLSQNLINWTLSNNHKRISLEVGVAYGTDIEKVKSIFKDIVEANAEVMKIPAPLILLNDFADSSLNFKVLCWVSDIDDWLRVRSILMSSIYEEFYKQEIKIPFPQRDVNVYLKENFLKDEKSEQPKEVDDKSELIKPII